MDKTYTFEVGQLYFDTNSDYEEVIEIIGPMHEAYYPCKVIQANVPSMIGDVYRFGNQSIRAGSLVPYEEEKIEEVKVPTVAFNDLFTGG